MKLADRVKGKLRTARVATDELDFPLFVREPTAGESIKIRKAAPKDDPESEEALRQMFLYCVLDDEQKQGFASLEEVDAFLDVVGNSVVEAISDAILSLRREGEPGKAISESETN
jgi:hypothetical protein